MPEINNDSIPPSLFVDNSLVCLQLSCWGGIAKVRKGDEEIFGSKSFDNEFFKGGDVILCGQQMLKPFKNRQQKLSGLIDSMSQPFFFSGARIVKNRTCPEICEAVRECQEDIRVLREVFLDQFPGERRARIEEFNRKHPESHGRLDIYYNDQNLRDLGSKFDVVCTTFAIRDVEEHNRIIASEAHSLRSRMRSFMDDVALNFRRSAVEAALAFKTGMEKASGTESGVVHGRSVKAFRDFLDRIERNDFLNDTKMKALLEDMKSKIFAVESWDVRTDEQSMNMIKSHLDEIVKLGENEGESKSVVESYVIQSVQSFELSSSDIEDPEPAPISFMPSSDLVEDGLLQTDPE